MTRMHSKVTATIAAGAAILLAATGCTSTKSGTEATSAAGGSGSSNASSGGTIKIGLVTKTETNPYFVKLRDAAQKQAQAKGAQLIPLAGKFDGDNEGQVAALENLIQQGVKGILVTPNNSTGILGALKKAKAAGIVVIALDTETSPKDAVDATFATDNTKAGELQGQYVKATLGGVAPKALLLNGTPGGSVDEQRHKGFLTGMGLSENDPAILGQANAMGDQNKAQSATENLLQRSADINAVYTLNEPTARGAYAALKAKGLAGKVTMGSIDGGCQAMDDIKNGLYVATVMQFPKKMAESGVDAVVKFAQDGTKPTGFNDTGAQLISDKPLPGMDIKDTAWGKQNCWG